MEKLTVVTGVGVPLRRSNVDTDQIIPAVFLKRVTKTGFDDALFYAWRRDPGVRAEQARIRRQGPHSGGRARTSGIGSSREHAVWGAA